MMVEFTRLGWPGRIGALAGVALVVAACQTTQVEQAKVESTPPNLSGEAYALVWTDAQEAMQDGDYETAFAAYQQILQSDPDSFPARFGISEVHLASGNWKAAMAMHRELTAPPEEYVARLAQGRGLAALLAGRIDRAKYQLKSAVDMNPQLWRAWNGLGYVHDSKGEWDQAQESYDRAIEIEPDVALVHNNLGMSYLLRGSHQEAEEAFVKALTLDPDLELAKVNLRLVLAWQGKYAEALTGMPRRAVPEVLNNVGYIAMLRGDLVDAEGYLTRAMEKSPSFNEAAWENMRQLDELKQRQM